MILKFIGMSDDLAQVAKHLIAESIGFKYQLGKVSFGEIITDDDNYTEEWIELLRSVMTERVTFKRKEGRVWQTI